MEPEKAELLLTYHFSDNVKDADRAREQQKNLLAVLRDFAIAPEKLTVYNVSASSSGGVYKVANATVFLTKQYKLVVEKPFIMDELIPKLIQSGADRVEAISLISSKLADFRLQVISKALADARTKAQYVARQMGTSVGKVYSVTEIVPAASRSETDLPSLYKMQAYAERQDQQEVSLRKIIVRANFSVEYEFP